MFWICLFVLVYTLITFTSIWRSAKLSFDIHTTTTASTIPDEKIKLKEIILSILALIFFGWLHLLYFYVDRGSLKSVYYDLIYEQRSLGMTKNQEIAALKIVDEYFGEGK
jgi:hypothetical protein